MEHASGGPVTIRKECYINYLLKLIEGERYLKVYHILLTLLDHKTHSLAEFSFSLTVTEPTAIPAF